MRQTLVIAAVAMSFSLGIRQNAWKLSDKMDVPEQTLKDELTQYVVPATEMFELGKEMAMETPPNAAHNYYTGVGSWFGTFCRENKEFPSREQMLEGMAEGVNALFKDSLSRTQQDSLAEKLKKFT